MILHETCLRKSNLRLRWRLVKNSRGHDWDWKGRNTNTNLKSQLKTSVWWQKTAGRGHKPQMKTFEECQRIAGGERMALMISTALQMLPEVLWLRESNSSRSWEEAPWRQAPTHLLESASTEENHICKKKILSCMEKFIWWDGAFPTFFCGRRTFPISTYQKSNYDQIIDNLKLSILLKKTLLNLVKMATTCVQWSSASPLTCSCRHCNL